MKMDWSRFVNKKRMKATRNQIHVSFREHLSYLVRKFITLHPWRRIYLWTLSHLVVVRVGLADGEGESRP